MENFFELKDGAKLFYRVDDFTDPWRCSPTVVMVHGVAESTEAWYAWVPYFARHYRVVRVDVRGFGRSTPMPASFEWSLDILADDLAAFTRYLNCGPVHMVSAKSGGTIAFKMVADHGDLVRTLTGITPAAKGKETATGWITQITEHGIHQWARDTMKGRLGSAVTPEEFDWWVNEIQGKTPVSTMQGYLRMVPHMDIREDVERIACPTLIVTTAGGGLHSLDSYKEWQPRIKNSELVEIEGDAWHAAGAYPDRCAQLTVDFIKRHS